LLRRMPAVRPNRRHSRPILRYKSDAGRRGPWMSDAQDEPNTPGAAPPWAQPGARPLVRFDGVRRRYGDIAAVDIAPLQTNVSSSLRSRCHEWSRHLAGNVDEMLCRRAESAALHRENADRHPFQWECNGQRLDTLVSGRKSQDGVGKD
jgi:hypothetical protein